MRYKSTEKWLGKTEYIFCRNRRKLHGSERESVKYDSTERGLGLTFYTNVFK